MYLEREDSYTRQVCRGCKIWIFYLELWGVKRGGVGLLYQNLVSVCVCLRLFAWNHNNGGTCCVWFETSHTFRTMQTDATLLANKTQQCFDLLCSFAWIFRIRAWRPQFWRFVENVNVRIRTISIFMQQFKNKASIFSYSHTFRQNKRETHELIYKQKPGAPLTNFNDGRVRQRFIFYTQKNHNFRICLPKKITTFLACPKKSLSPFFATPINPSVFFSRPQKIPASFLDPKNQSDPPPPSRQ